METRMKHVHQLHLGIALALCISACSDKASKGANANHASATATQRPGPSSQPSIAPTASAAPTASTSSAPQDGRTISISVEQLVKHDGTAMGLSFPHPDGWIGGVFDHGNVAWSSSPPGDSSMMRVWSYKKPTHDFATLKDLVKTKNPEDPLGAEDKLSLAGAERVAMSNQHGAGLAASATCRAMIPGPAGSAFGLVVELTSSWRDDGKQATCAEIAASRDLATIASQLHIDISGSD